MLTFKDYLKESSEHLVHVSDGSKYGDKPHDDDVAHVMAGAKKHGGEFDGHSDKGAYFKFKSQNDASSFKKHVDSCPKGTCYADLHEETELDENNWIAGAIKHPGAETRAAKKAGMSVQAYAHEHEHDSGKAGKRARLAITLANLRKK